MCCPDPHCAGIGYTGYAFVIGGGNRPMCDECFLTLECPACGITAEPIAEELLEAGF